MNQQIQPTVSLAEIPKIPEAYRDAILAFLRLYWQGRRWEMQESFGFHQLPLLTDDQLLTRPLADTLAEIARAAAGEIQHSEDGFAEGVVYQGIQGLMEALFCPPGLTAYDPPPAHWWETDLGHMVARALLWIKADELISLKEAAEIRGVSVPAISRAVQNGRLTRYVDPDAPKRQGRTLVSRAQVEGMNG